MTVPQNVLNQVLSAYTKVKQANLHGFLPDFYWPDYICHLPTFWQLNIYFCHAKSERPNVSVVLLNP